MNTKTNLDDNNILDQMIEELIIHSREWRIALNYVDQNEDVLRKRIEHEKNIKIKLDAFDSQSELFYICVRNNMANFSQMCSEFAQLIDVYNQFINMYIVVNNEYYVSYDNMCFLDRAKSDLMYVVDMFDGSHNDCIKKNAQY